MCPKISCQVAATLLAALSNAALADWTPLIRQPAETDYADPATIRKSGNTVKMWDLMDFQNLQAPGPNEGSWKPYMSVRAQREYDCKEEQYRVLIVDFNSRQYGAGCERKYKYRSRSRPLGANCAGQYCSHSLKVRLWQAIAQCVKGKLAM